MAAKTRKPDEEIKSSEKDSPSARFVLSAFAWLLALILAYYYLPLTQQADFYISDTCYFFEPFAKFIGEQLKSGIVPFWNPLLHCGMSQLAVPSPGLFYPPSYLLFLLPFSQGLSIYMILHQLLFAVGGYLYLKETGMSRSAALLFAFSLGLSSYCFCLTRNPTLPATIAWLPLSLYLQCKINAQGGAKQVGLCVALAASISMCIAAGRPEIFLPCVLLAIFHSFAAQFSDWINGAKTRGFGKDNIYKLASVFAGIGMAAPVIAPALEWSALSPRAHGLSQTDVLSWSANSYDFLSMLLSFPLGDVCSLSESSAVLQNLFLSKSMSLPFLCSSYIGPVILCFSLFAFCSKEFKARGLLLALFIIISVLAAGSYTPVAPLLLKAMPALSIIRYPVKLLIFPALILAYAAAFGFDLALKRKLHPPLCKGVIGLSAISFLIALVTFIFPNFGLLGPQYLSGNYAPILRAANLSLAGSMAEAAVLGTITGFACLFHQNGKFASARFRFAILALASIALFLSSSTFPYLTKPGFYKSESTMFGHLAQFLGENASKTGSKGRILPFYTDGLLLPEGAFKIDPKLSYEERFYAYSRLIGRFNTAQDFAIPQSFGYEAAVTAALSSLYAEAREYSTQFLDGSNHPKPISDRPIWRFCRLTGAEYLLTQAAVVTKDLPLPELDDRLFELFGKSEKNNSRIFTVIKPRTRIHFADELKLVDSWGELKKILTNPDEIADDKAKVDYLLKTAANEQLASASQGSESPGSSFKLEVDNGQVLQLTTNVAGQKAQILIVQDQFYPGWKAEIDGTPAEIINANMIGRALVLQPGEHKVKFYFAADSLKTGFLIQLASLAGLIALLFAFSKVKTLGEPRATTGGDKAKEQESNSNQD